MVGVEEDPCNRKDQESWQRQAQLYIKVGNVKSLKSVKERKIYARSRGVNFDVADMSISPVEVWF